MEEISSNLEGSTKDYLNIKNILKNENLDDMLLDMNDEDCKKIKEELNAYKQKREKEIEILENELKQLNDESVKYENANENEEDDNIILDENLKEQLKKEIINEIEPKIKEELKNQQLDINKKLKNIENDNNELINSSFQNIKNDIEKFLQNYKNNNNRNIKEKNVEQNKLYENNKDNSNLFNKKQKAINNINNIRPIEKNNMKIQNNNNIHTNYFKNNNNNDYNKYGLSDAKFKHENPVKFNLNIQNDKYKEKKRSVDKNKYQDLFLIFNNIFFKNENQTSINGEKIDEKTTKELTKMFNNYQKKREEFVLQTYFDNFIKENVLKIFGKSDIREKVLENIKYNIENINEIFGLNRYSYKDYYYPNLKANTQIRDRKKSSEAAKRFRRTFNIDEKVIIEEELLKRLDKNDNDINKVMQQMFG